MKFFKIKQFFIVFLFQIFKKIKENNNNFVFIKKKIEKTCVKESIKLHFFYLDIYLFF